MFFFRVNVLLPKESPFYLRGSKHLLMKKSRSSCLGVIGILLLLYFYLSAGSYDSQVGNAISPWNFHNPNTHLVIGKLITVAQLLCEQSTLSVLIFSPHSSSVMHHISFFSAPLPTVTD